MARKLKDVEIEEITICDEPANRKKFYIKKTGGIKMDKLLEVLKKILGDDEISNDSIEKIKGIPEDKIEGIRKALDEIEGYQENFPPALDEAFLSLAKSAVYDYPVKESELDFEDIEKAGASLSKATVAQLRKIQEIIEKLVGEKTKKLKKNDKDEFEIPEDIQAKLDKLEKLEKAEKEKEEKDATEKVEKAEKEKEELLKRVEKLEKKKGTKKSIDGQGNDDAGDDNDEEDPYPSIPVVR